MSIQTTNAVVLATPPSQIELIGLSLTTITTTPAVSQPGTTLSSVLTGAGRWTVPTVGWNYAKIVPVFNTSAVTFNLGIIGWNRGGLVGTSGANVYNWVPQQLAQLSVTSGTVAVSGTSFGTVYGAASMALSQGDAKIYNAALFTPTGFFVVDTLGCEMLSITGSTVSGSLTFSAWVGRV